LTVVLPFDTIEGQPFSLGFWRDTLTKIYFVDPSHTGLLGIPQDPPSESSRADEPQHHLETELSFKVMFSGKDESVERATEKEFQDIATRRC